MSRQDRRVLRDRLEEGSGTLLGAMLIMTTGIMLVVAASVGNLLVCRSQARSLADLVAFESASAWRLSLTQEPCSYAHTLADMNDVTVTQCDTVDEDVVLTLQVPTQVPLVPNVHGQSKAGPINCE